MNTHARETVAARPNYGAGITCGVALACAAYAYSALDPVLAARASLDACVRERLAQYSDVAGAATATSASDKDREQVLSAAFYACSAQP